MRPGPAKPYFGAVLGIGSAGLALRGSVRAAKLAQRFGRSSLNFAAALPRQFGPDHFINYPSSFPEDMPRCRGGRQSEKPPDA